MLVSHHPAESCWTSFNGSRIWRPTKTPSLILARRVYGIYHAGIGKLAKSGPRFSRSSSSNLVWCEGVVAGFCLPRPELGAGCSSLQVLHFLCKTIPSASSAIQLLGCLTHMYFVLTLRQSRLKGNYLQITTEMPAIRFTCILNAIQ